jgi:hypothetical protein
MALSKVLHLTNNFGDLTDVDCYIRVSEVRAAKTQAVAEVDILKADKSRVIEKRDYIFQPDLSESSANMWKQAYDHLKTVQEFTGSVDC